jgi:hypothetical protein
MMPDVAGSPVPVCSISVRPNGGSGGDPYSHAQNLKGR